MSMDDDGGGFMDMILGFVLDLLDSFQGVMDMLGAVGRKKRSVLSEVLSV